VVIGVRLIWGPETAPGYSVLVWHRIWTMKAGGMVWMAAH